MKISEVAKLTGVTVRTLQYYDKIGLLNPDEVTDSGYRLYSEESLEVLQQILFFRELDFPLSEIKEIMINPNYDKIKALNKQRELLLKKRERLEKLINLVDNSIKGESSMSFKEFDKNDIENIKRKYADEVKRRWGNTDAYKESEKKTTSYDSDKWSEVNEEMKVIFNEFSSIVNEDPGCEKAQALVKQWQEYISNNFYKCTKEILAGLGLMYANDERFKENIDKSGEGTADFMAIAIEIYCSK